MTYGRPTSSEIFDKVAYRATIGGVPMVLAAANVFGLFFLIVLPLVVVFLVLRQPLGAIWALPVYAVVAGGVHLWLMRLSAHDPHLETVLRMRWFPPNTKHKIVRRGGGPPTRFGRPRTRGVRSYRGRVFLP